MEEINIKEAAGCIFICSKTERVLLNLRAPYKSHDLTWSLWGGMIEEGEIPKDCLFRELQEEMGFVPTISRVYPYDVYCSKDKKFKYYSFVIIVEEEFVPILNKESAGYCWIQLGQWPRPMHQGAKGSFCNEKSNKKLRMILDQHV